MKKEKYSIHIRRNSDNSITEFHSSTFEFLMKVLKKLERNHENNEKEGTKVRAKRTLNKSKTKILKSI